MTLGVDAIAVIILKSSMLRQRLPRGKAGWGNDAFPWCGYAQPGRLKAVLGAKGKKMGPSLLLHQQSVLMTYRPCFQASQEGQGKQKRVDIISFST